MKSLLFVFFWALIKFFPVNAGVLEYRLLNNQPLTLTQANLKILAFHLLPNWIDVTLEYTHNGSVQSSQWFGIGFGNTFMDCTYAITFEPQLDAARTTITDLIITERRLGNHFPGTKLSRRLAYIETDIVTNPNVVIRSRFIRERVVPVNYLILRNESCANNLYGYYQFPFDGSDINIIFAKGANGAQNVSYHGPTNHGTGSISLEAVTSIMALNSTGLANVTSFSTLMSVTCPQRSALKNYTFAQRFDWPFAPRVCGMCESTNSTYNVTLMPQSTQIQSGVTTFSNGDNYNTTEEYECMVMSNGSYPNPPVCGCTNVEWNDTSIVFLVDGAGYQNDTEWRRFTWRILEGFLANVMESGNASLLNLNATLNASIEGADVNVILYGGKHKLQVQKLTWTLLQSIETDPIPYSERAQSNLCNATNFAAQYLSSSGGHAKILVTIPWQSPSDELDCLICTNCTLAGIHTFTAKVFDEVDLSLIEMTFGAYDDCTYLYDDPLESRKHGLQEWSYVLAAISDFICFASENPITTGGNFSLSLLMTSALSAQDLYNYSLNISNIIESAFEIVSNFSYESDREFDVTVASVNESYLKTTSAPSSGTPTYVSLINSIVMCKDSEIKLALEKIAKSRAFAQFLNNSFYQFFADSNALTVVYSVGGVVLFNETVFTTTGIQTTQFATTQIVTTQPVTTEFFTSEVSQTTVFPTVIGTSSTHVSPHHVANSVLARIRRFFNHLVAWQIVVIVIGGTLLCLLLMCICGFCVRLCRNRESYAYATAAGHEYDEKVPVIVTNAQPRSKYGNNQYNQTSRVADDDQVYV